VPPIAAPEFPSRVYNNAGSIIPAYGVMACSMSLAMLGTRSFVNVVQPSSTPALVYLINGPREIAVDGYGQAQSSEFQQALYDSSGATPGSSTPFGPTPGQWYLGTGTQGYLTFGVTDSTNHVCLCRRGPTVGQVIKGTLSANLTIGGSSVNLSGAVAVSGGPAPSGTITPTNPLGLAGLSGDLALAIFDQSLSTPGWIFLQVQHHATTVMTAHQWNESLPGFQYRTLSLAAMVNGTQSDWINEVTATKCPPTS